MKSKLFRKNIKQHDKISKKNEPFDNRSNSMFLLQKTVGNSDVQELITRNNSVSKLKVSNPVDSAEIQADRIADKVTQKQNIDADEIIKNTENLIQHKGSQEDFVVSKNFEKKLSQQNGRGKPIDKSMRNNMKERFGMELPGLKIHTGSDANLLAESIDARAFTHGQDVYFSDGEYNPHSKDGENLIAHEFTHALQHTDKQTDVIQRKPGKKTKSEEKRKPGEKLEIERRFLETSDNEFEIHDNGVNIHADDFSIHQYCLSSMDNFSYFIYDPVSKEAIVIDPSGDPGKILSELEELELSVKYVVNTHGHFDHTAGNRDIIEKTGAQLLIHKADRKRIRSFLNGFLARRVLKGKSSPKADRTLKDGDEITVGSISLKVIHTPGHTKGSICLYTENKDGQTDIFTGDTLFQNGAAGATWFPGSSRKKIIKSIREKILTLPKDTRVWSGHYTSGKHTYTTLEWIDIFKDVFLK